MSKECRQCHRSFLDKVVNCPYDGSLLVHNPETSTDIFIDLILDNKYQIKSKIGEGSICNIYRALVLESGYQCAIKILRPTLAKDEASITRFKYEVRAAHKVQHPNVVQLLDANILGTGPMYMVMELLEGVTLKQELQKSGPLGLERTKTIVRQICEGLQAAHTKGIIHRDLKPDNIMLVKQNDNPSFVKLLDFGIAKVNWDKSITAEYSPSNIVMGTPRYMSPEQCKGQQIDLRSDIYSLGIIIYELLSGMPPFIDASPQALLNKHAQETVPSLKRKRPSLPSSVERAIMHALEKSPLKRPLSVIEFAQEFEDAINLEPSISPDISRAPDLKQLLNSQSPNLIPVVKQQSNNFSIVEYIEPEKSLIPNHFASEQIKTELKNNWHYLVIGIILLVIVILIIAIIILLMS
ncbi:MAG: serine/threonine protein kinase [Blastocatellia bacterium]|nr:serine/threonine protein kinase [Blastocatellia bacterium]MBL8194819.1 serine/threonine protein kinase [Blastocatellia bacterium]MBN8723146.1 serine/threonine protein kinase [Acidobacteriota bacterium]